MVRRQFSSSIDKVGASDVMLCAIDNNRQSGEIGMWSTSLRDPELQQNEARGGENNSAKRWGMG